MSIEGFGAREGRGVSAWSWSEEWKRRRGDLRRVRLRHWRQVKGRVADIIFLGEML